MIDVSESGGVSKIADVDDNSLELENIFSLELEKIFSLELESIFSSLQVEPSSFSTSAELMEVFLSVVEAEQGGKEMVVAT